MSIANSGKAAVDLINSQIFDLIITDVRLQDSQIEIDKAFLKEENARFSGTKNEIFFLALKSLPI